MSGARITRYGGGGPEGPMNFLARPARPACLGLCQPCFRSTSTNFDDIPRPLPLSRRAGRLVKSLGELGAVVGLHDVLGDGEEREDRAVTRGAAAEYEDRADRVAKG